MTEFLNEWAWFGWVVGGLFALFGLVMLTLVTIVFVKVFRRVLGKENPPRSYRPHG